MLTFEKRHETVPWADLVHLDLAEFDKGLEARQKLAQVFLESVHTTGFLYLVSAVLSDDQFSSWGWRVPFLFSIVLVGIGLYIRLQILETPMFAKRVKQGQLSRLPSFEVWRHHWKPIVLSAFARLLVGSYSKTSIDEDGFPSRPANLQHLVGPGAARRGDLDRVALALADQGPRDRG